MRFNADTKNLRITIKTIRLIAVVGIAIVLFSETPQTISTDYFPPLLLGLQRDLAAIFFNLK